MYLLLDSRMKATQFIITPLFYCIQWENIINMILYKLNCVVCHTFACSNSAKELSSCCAATKNSSMIHLNIVSAAEPATLTAVTSGSCSVHPFIQPGCLFQRFSIKETFSLSHKVADCFCIPGFYSFAMCAVLTYEKGRVNIFASTYSCQSVILANSKFTSGWRSREFMMWLFYCFQFPHTGIVCFKHTTLTVRVVFLWPRRKIWCHLNNVYSVESMLNIRNGLIVWVRANASSTEPELIWRWANSQSRFQYRDRAWVHFWRIFFLYILLKTIVHICWYSLNKADKIYGFHGSCATTHGDTRTLLKNYALLLSIVNGFA